LRARVSFVSVDAVVDYEKTKSPSEEGQICVTH
jgi:hypothetical protein